VINYFASFSAVYHEDSPALNSQRFGVFR